MLTIAIAAMLAAPTPHEVLAISWAAESGWGYLPDATLRLADYNAMGHIFVRRARTNRMTPDAFARRYCAVWWHSKHRRSWKRNLRDACKRPRRWPYSSHRWWSHYRWLCFGLMDHARQFLADPNSYPDPCRGEATDFNCPGCPVPTNMVRVDCGPTKQAYYRRTK